MFALSHLQLFRFRFRCLSATHLPANGHELARRLLFQRLATIDPVLAEQLQQQVPQPFSLSPIWRDKGGHTLHLPAGAPAWFQVGALSARLCEPLQALTLSPPQELRIDAVHLTLQAVEAVRPAPLTPEALFASDKEPTAISLRFLSPTILLERGAPTLFPNPRPLFGSLLTLFHQHTAFHFPLEALAMLQRLRITRYNLHTVAVDCGSYTTSGFVGRIQYAFPADLPPPMAHLAIALSRFARFSAVGEKRHLGMGQAEPIEEER